MSFLYLLFWLLFWFSAFPCLNRAGDQEALRVARLGCLLECPPAEHKAYIFFQIVDAFRRQSGRDVLWAIDLCLHSVDDRQKRKQKIVQRQHLWMWRMVFVQCFACLIRVVLIGSAISYWKCGLHALGSAVLCCVVRCCAPKDCVPDEVVLLKGILSEEMLRDEEAWQKMDEYEKTLGVSMMGAKKQLLRSYFESLHTTWKLHWSVYEGFYICFELLGMCLSLCCWFWELQQMLGLSYFQKSGLKIR